MPRRFLSPFSSKPPKLHPFTEDQVRSKAYELWQYRGTDSSAEDNWNDAIKALYRQRLLQGLLLPRRIAIDLANGVWRWTGFGEKTGWDFLQLLVVPVVLASVGFGLQEYAKDRDRKLSDDKAKQDQKLTDDKAKQDTLVKYLDQMADSLKDGLLQAKPGSEKFIVAQARTVITLQSLDGKRQRLVIQFLRASGLSKARNETDPGKLSDDDKVLLYQSQMEKANFAGSDLSGAIMIGASLQGSDFSCVASEGKDRQCSDLGGIDLRGANLNGANLDGANLGNADLRGAELFLTILSNARLVGANLSGALLDNAELVNTNFNQSEFVGSSLFNASLNGAKLSFANLSRANLISANLDGADLEGANLRGANLRRANLNGANSARANFTDADLDGVNLRNAQLTLANLKNAKLVGANLSGADLTATKNLTDNQLRYAHLCQTKLFYNSGLSGNRDCGKTQ